ncbi:MAG TPA: aminoglycoside phosphotransferase [Jatrophihabitans sp.]
MSDAFLDAIVDLIREWLPQQRWFSGRGREFSAVVLREIAYLGEIHFVFAQLDYADGGGELYQVPLVLHAQPTSALEHVLLGTVDTADGPRWVYDALHDKDVTGAWLSALSNETPVDALRFHRIAEAEAIPVSASSLPMTAEQSNTSLVFDDVAILKVFRRLQPGINPDIEVLQALTERGGAHVAGLLGWVSADVDGPDSTQEYALATLQEFLITATDGWDLAHTSIRDLLADTSVSPEEAGGDFSGEAERLGEAIASVHADLAEAFGAHRATAQDLAEQAERMHRRLDDAVDVVPELGDLAAALHARFDAFAADGETLDLQRIHGDLHLGQVLRTVRRWVVIDFEGEPTGVLLQRRAFRSPLQDVAGMLRSFDYAAQHRVIELARDQNVDVDLLRGRAAEWTVHNRNAFLDGYRSGTGIDARESPVALTALVADKAVYEAVYEARFRPTWLPIPLASLTALAEVDA